MGRAVELAPADESALKVLVRAGLGILGPRPSATALEGYVQQENHALWERWVDATPSEESRRRWVRAERRRVAQGVGKRPRRAATEARPVTLLPHLPTIVGVGEVTKLDAAGWDKIQAAGSVYAPPKLWLYWPGPGPLDECEVEYGRIDEPGRCELVHLDPIAGAGAVNARAPSVGLRHYVDLSGPRQGECFVRIRYISEGRRGTVSGYLVIGGMLDLPQLYRPARGAPRPIVL